MNVKVKLLRADAQLPQPMTAGAAGADLYACFGLDDFAPIKYKDPPIAGARRTIKVRPGEVVTIPTGIAIEMEPGFFAQICPRSGATKAGLLVQLGTIDSDYRGELKVQATFVSCYGKDSCYYLNSGDRIAQLVFRRAIDVGFEAVDALSSTARGEGGFGSTGTK
jgi:dUTP pyrophosphatase